MSAEQRLWARDHDDDTPRTCPSCGANEYVCARKASNGGRVCCESCSHVVARVVPRREAS